MYKFIFLLLVHVIKIHAQEEINPSWQGTINNACKYINKYIDSSINLEDELIGGWADALDYASTEVFRGIEKIQLENRVNKKIIILHCLSLINR